MHYLATLVLMLTCCLPLLAYTPSIYAQGIYAQGIYAQGIYAQALDSQAITLVAPPLALASVYRGDENLDFYWVSEKYDGVRAYWNGKTLRTRSGRRINAPAQWLAQLPDISLDGELWIGHHQFDAISGLVRQKNPTISDWASVRFLVFDLPDHPAVFSQRYQALVKLSQRYMDSPMQRVKQDPVVSHAVLQRQLIQAVSLGAEGLMLSANNSHYQAGRSRTHLKLKPYMDAEAMVIGHQPGKGKYQGLLGALLVEDDQGRKFKIGTGFSDDQRAYPPPKGATITYTYHGLTRHHLPRFASYLRTRKPE